MTNPWVVEYYRFERLSTVPTHPHPRVWDRSAGYDRPQTFVECLSLNYQLVFEYDNNYFRGHPYYRIRNTQTGEIITMEALRRVVAP